MLTEEASLQHSNGAGVVLRLADPPITQPSFYRRAGKRALDVAIVSLLAPLWVPVYLIVAALVLMLEGRPIHFVASRTGEGCCPFRMFKFRTMRTNADEMLPGLLASNQELAEEYRTFNKLKDDPRVSRFGRFLRRTSLDEVPQLLNVVLGDMSLVGPRPPSSVHDTPIYYGSSATEVFSCPPGMTGIWQVSDRHTNGYDHRVDLDIEYAQSCSLATDVKILARTIPTVLTGRGAI